MNPERHRADPAPRRAPCENRAMQPTPDEVRTALERVLASGSFTGTSRLSRFLRFVVERSLAGEAERLKEYLIGVEVFDRDERYDPRIDSIVRVEAGRLRAKLDEYYRGAGAGDAVAIVLEKGSYAPGFVRRADAPTIPLAPPAESSLEAVGACAPASVARRRRLAIASIAVLVVAALAVGAASWRGARRAAAEPPKTVVAVLPFTSYSSDADARVLATRLTDSVTGELVRIGRFSVVASSTARQVADSRAPAHDIARDLHADLLVEARVDSQDGALKVGAMVIDGVRDRKLWFETLTGDAANLDDLARRIAVAAAGAPLSAPP
jgi:TolB-like protein